MLRWSRSYRVARPKKSREEGVMKCANPDCNRGIGLVYYRRGWTSTRRYCSMNCRDTVVAGLKQKQHERSGASYFDWLFSQPIEKRPQRLVHVCHRSGMDENQISRVDVLPAAKLNHVIVTRFNMRHAA
jgi:hypothetical protein